MTLDLRLGGRMLVKHPGLTIIGGLAMAFAICVGAVVFEMAMLFVSPTLPLPGGDRIVHLRNWDVQENDDAPGALHDFVVWRQAMRTVTDFGAFENVVRNLKGRDGEPRPLQIAAITASGFRVAATPPLLGRALLPADERVGAPPVIVLGHDVWEARFASDPAFVGQNVQLGDTYATVVGVMPDGFEFPVAHEAWTPFRPSVLDEAPGRGPEITIFGRLAPDATLDEARAELSTIGHRAARELPDTHQHLQPQVLPYAQIFAMSMEEGGALLLLTQIFALMLLVLVCGSASRPSPLVLSVHVPDQALRLSEARIPLEHVAILVVYAASLLGVCLLACVLPTQRALRVEPTVAMRVEQATRSGCRGTPDPASTGATEPSRYPDPEHSEVWRRWRR